MPEPKAAESIINFLTPITLVKCSTTGENGVRSGHMHMGGPSAKITKIITSEQTGEKTEFEAGEIGMDIWGANILLTIHGERYHIPAVDIWKAVEYVLEVREWCQRIS